MKESYVVLPKADLMKCDVVGGCCIFALNFFTTGAGQEWKFFDDVFRVMMMR